MDKIPSEKPSIPSDNSGISPLASLEARVQIVVQSIKKFLENSPECTEVDLKFFLIGESQGDSNVARIALKTLKDDPNLKINRQLFVNISRDFSVPQAVEVDSIIPTQIFGARPRPQEKREIEGKAREVVRAFKQALQESIEAGEDCSEAAITDFIRGESKGNLNVLHFALNILKKDPKLVSQKSILTKMDEEVLSDIQKPFMQAIEACSPREISLKEGDLPAVPQNIRELIEGYREGKVLLNSVQERLRLTPQNARQILKYIKIIDLETDRLSLGEKRAKKIEDAKTTYPLRTFCLQAAEGGMTTFEAYTKSIRDDLYNNPFAITSREYASHEYNYIPERVRDHVRILAQYATEMMALSRRMNPPKRTFFCIGGNTAVGKSRCVKQDETFKRGLVNGELVGALNPDTVKYKLRKGVPNVTNQQVHVEGFVVGQKLSIELQNRALKASIIIDERLSVPAVVQSILDKAQQTDSVVRLKDIEGPLMLSCLRVLGRDIKTDPCVPFNPIAGGYKALRENRKAVVEMVIKSNAIESYELFAMDEQNQQRLVAVKKNGELVILEQALYAQAISKPTDEEIAQVRSTILTEEFIQSVANLPGVEQKALRGYMGKTIEVALEEHSKKLPD